MVIKHDALRVILKLSVSLENESWKTKQKQRNKVFSAYVVETREIVSLKHFKEIIKTAINDPDFLDSIVNGHEVWCFMCDPKTKHQSGERKLEDETKTKEISFSVPMS